MNQKLLEAAKRFAGLESPVQHELLVYFTPNQMYVAECLCGNWYQAAYIHGAYAPFDPRAAHAHHVLISNYAAGVAQPEKIE